MPAPSRARCTRSTPPPARSCGALPAEGRCWTDPPSWMELSIGAPGTITPGHRTTSCTPSPSRVGTNPLGYAAQWAVSGLVANNTAHNCAHYFDVLDLAGIDLMQVLR